MVPVVMHKLPKRCSAIDPGAIVMLNALAGGCSLLCSTIPHLPLHLNISGLMPVPTTFLKYLLSLTSVQMLLYCTLSPQQNCPELLCSSFLSNPLRQLHRHHSIVIHAKQLKVPGHIVQPVPDLIVPVPVIDTCHLSPIRKLQGISKPAPNIIQLITQRTETL
jgi:hypothetical protein